MTIGIDGNEANTSELVGVSVYTASLLSYFQKNSSKELKFEIFLRNTPNNNLPKETDSFRYNVVGPKYFWSQISLPIALRKRNDLDVFFSPAHYSPRFCPSPSIVTIHDLSYFYYPGEFLKKDLHKLIHWTKYSVERAKNIICVSENTKKDLMKFYNTAEEKINVIYNGFEKKNSSSKTPSLNSQKPYVLYVGTLQPRKNIETLIRAFFEFKKSNSDFNLRLVGKKGWMYENIFNLVKELRLEKEVLFEGYVPDNKLIELYRNAFCFVLPSFYEGFGIPILEAMSYGCPVIASNTSSLPEIGGDACLYFDPKKTKELTLKLLALKNEQLRKNLVEKGIKRIKNFSWEKCAKETLDVFKKQ